MSNEVRSRVSRYDVPEQLYFITTVTQNRKPIFRNEQNIALFRRTLHRVAQHHPFGMRGYAILWDHVHLLMQLYADTNISRLMHSLKYNFTRNYKATLGIDAKTSVNLWQRSFYDHVIRDAEDFENHLNYIHYNPVKHSLVAKPEDYRHTSYLTYVRKGWYELGWGHPDEERYKPMYHSEVNEWGE